MPCHPLSPTHRRPSAPASQRFGFGMFQTAVGFTRETFSFLVALSAFVAVIWAAGNIPAVLHLIQLAIIKVRGDIAGTEL